MEANTLKYCNHALNSEDHHRCRHGGCAIKNKYDPDNCFWCSNPEKTWDEVVKESSLTRSQLYKKSMKKLRDLGQGSL